MEIVYDVLTALEKIGMVTDLPLETQQGVDFAEMQTKHGIAVELQNLSYRFSDINAVVTSKTDFVLRGLNLKILPNERVVIAGYNGSGKTTLVQIISCFLSNFEGAVLFNGVPRGNFNQNSLRRAIGDFSIQENVFKGSLRENITLGHAEISFDKLVATAESVGLMRFISSLPSGFDTILLPEGKNLPRNIVAKIILARSIVTQPQLLVVEELMANLEYTDRIRIAELLTDKNQPWTLIAVTDDPELARRCDRVIVMRDGQIIMDDTFEAIKKTEHFRKIFKIYDSD